MKTALNRPLPSGERTRIRFDVPLTSQMHPRNSSGEYTLTLTYKSELTGEDGATVFEVRAFMRDEDGDEIATYVTSQTVS
jgi:hypothetical protein